MHKYERGMKESISERVEIQSLDNKGGNDSTWYMHVDMCEADRFTYIMSSEDKDVCEITGRLLRKLVVVRGSL